VRHRAYSGFALPTAIFLVVILSALGAFVLTISSLQSRSLALEVQEAHAYQAAKAGIEYGAYQTLVNGACAGWTFSPGGTMAAMTVTVTCVSATADEAGVSRTIYTLVSTACNQPVAGACPAAAPGEAYVERQIQATIGG
jgi:MSHA biogenesis protein MshP